MWRDLIRRMFIVVDILKHRKQRMPKIRSWYSDYRILHEQGRGEKFEYYKAVELVLGSLLAVEEIPAQLERMAESNDEFVSFFESYWEEIMRAHRDRRAAERRLGQSPTAANTFFESVIEGVEEARIPTRRGLIDPEYSYIIAVAAKKAADKLLRKPIEREIIAAVRELLNAEGATRKEDSKYFDDEAREVISDAQDYVRGRLAYGNALGVNPAAPPEMVIIAVEKHRKLAAQHPKDAEDFVLFLNRKHPHQQRITEVARSNATKIRSLEDWLRFCQDHPEAFLLGAAQNI